MGRKDTWVLLDKWSLQDDCRMIFSDAPNQTHLIDVTVSAELSEGLVENVLKTKWTASELIAYLNLIFPRDKQGAL